MSFGKRVAPPVSGQAWISSAAVAAPSPAHAPDRSPVGDLAPEQYAMVTAADWTPGAGTRRGAAGLPPPDRRLALKIGGAVLLLFIWYAVTIGLEHHRPDFRVLSSGQTQEASAYAAPPGCPVRTWSVGDYLPRACQKGQRIDAAGLQPPGDGRHQRWLRAGPDALAVACPIFGDCQIQGVVRDRFTGDRPVEDPNAPGRDFRRRLPTYGLDYPIKWQIWASVAAAVCVNWVLRRMFRR